MCPAFTETTTTDPGEMANGFNTPVGADAPVRPIPAAIPPNFGYTAIVDDTSVGALHEAPAARRQ